MPFFSKQKNGIRTAKRDRQKSFQENLHAKRKKIKNVKNVEQQTQKNNLDEEITDVETDEEVIERHDQEIKNHVENETPEEKRIRWAKSVLQDTYTKQQDKLLNEEQHITVENETNIEKALHEEHLRQTDQFHYMIADSITPNLESIHVFKSKEHRNIITCLCANNSFIYSGSADGGLTKWNIQTRTKVIGLMSHRSQKSNQKIIGHLGSILCIAINTSCTYLALGDVTKNITIRSPSTLDLLGVLKGHTKSVTALTFRRNTNTLYSGSHDKSLKVWNVETMNIVETVFGHTDFITAMDCAYEEEPISAGGMDNSARKWSIIKESHLVYDCPGSVDCIQNIDNNHFLIGGNGGNVSIYSYNKKKPITSVSNAHGIHMNGLPYWVVSVAAAYNTNLLASGSYDGFIRLYEFKPGELMKVLSTIPLNGFINAMSFTPDRKYLIASVGREHRLGRWHVIKGIPNAIYLIPLTSK